MKQIDLCHQVLDWQKRRTECAADIQRISTSLEQTAPWQSLDVPFRFGGTRTTAAFIGVLPARFSETELRDALAGKEPGAAFEVEVLHTSPEQTCLFLLCRREDAAALGQTLRSMGFSRPPVTAGTSKQGMLPTDEIGRLQDRRRALEEERADLTRQIDPFPGGQGDQGVDVHPRLQRGLRLVVEPKDRSVSDTQSL